MPSGRLQQQFIRLWQCCEGQSQETTLNELADLLNCSRRHMRQGGGTPDAGLASRAELPPGPSHSAGAVLPSDEKSVTGKRLTPLGNAHGAADFQRPDAHK